MIPPESYGWNVRADDESKLNSASTVSQVNGLFNSGGRKQKMEVHSRKLGVDVGVGG